MDKNKILNVISIIFMVFLAGIIFNIFYYKEYHAVLWICYTAILLIIVGIMRRNSSLILSQVIILAIPDLFWIIDFFAILLTGNSPFALSVYVFQDNPFIKKFIAMQHLFTVPLALYAFILINKKPSKYTPLVSLIEVSLFFFITRAFIQQNINCVYQSCANFSWGSYYPMTWFVTYFSIIILAYLILFFVFRFSNRKIS